MTVTTAINALPTPETTDDQDMVAQMAALSSQADNRLVSRYISESQRDSANPTPVVGQLVYTSDEGLFFNRKTTGGWVLQEQTRTTVKMVAESVTSSTVLQADNELFFYAEANSRYLVELAVAYEGANATGNFKTNWAYPTDTTFMSGVRLGHWQPSGGTPNNTGYTIRSLSVADIITATFGAGVVCEQYETFIINTGSTPGNVTLMWSQGTSSATATTLRATSSFITYTKLI